VSHGWELLLADICEQPEVLARLLSDERVSGAASVFVPEGRPLVRLAGHGTSRNAATYAGYLLSTRLGLPCLTADIAATLAHRSPESLDGSVVIAFSQSGQTADIVAYTEFAGRGGARTVGLSNDDRSALATAADVHVDVGAGAERVIPATKTYTAEVLAAALIVQEVSASADVAADLADLPEHARSLIDRGLDWVRPVAERLVEVDRIIVVGDGFERATAREVALKLIEAAGITATAYDSLEALHGHLATADPGTAVLVIATAGPLLGDIELVAQAASAYGSPVIAIGDACDQVFASKSLSVPSVTESLAPLLTVIAGQLLACELARLRGSDAVNPPGLQKLVTARPSYVDSALGASS
jgi:glucosamine--fructose-6-phosphate aminotransferase (isomerizing)